MKKKPTKVPKNRIITIDQIKFLYFKNYGYKIITFADSFLNFVKDLGFTIKDENKRN